MLQLVVKIRSIQKFSKSQGESSIKIYIFKFAYFDSNQSIPCRYTYEDLESLKQSQMVINNKVSEHIQKSNLTDKTKEEFSDEFNDDEMEKMQSIKDIRQKRKIADSGVAMNTEKAEFLAPKDVHMAQEDIQELKDGIYAINQTPNDVFDEDIDDGESWVDKQLKSALGTNHDDYDTTQLARYNFDTSTNDFEQPEIREIRMIKA